ncbi:hypothetical protein M948_19665 [Virgibacillus sp. CM-4]|uniref:Uncharacterized protein n=1 Tax=Virgibacillus massiliensis TaxID=1462526 RepID=A0A024QE85_9BACI|nr:hypothetical protein M948_19665 [Virgibacillus sp. CM-4]CDQ40537.1 hypothetical protein BN990_02862 [Virgibacillus massiliensis]
MKLEGEISSIISFDADAHTYTPNSHITGADGFIYKGPRGI